MSIAKRAGSASTKFAKAAKSAQAAKRAKPTKAATAEKPATPAKAEKRAKPATPTKPAAPAKPGYHHGDLRQALLNAAESLLERQGIEGLTLRACARAAGVSHGAPAHHFGDVGGLMSAFTAQSFDGLAAAMAAARAAAAPTPLAQLIASGLGYFDYACAHPARFRLMFRAERLRRSDELGLAGDRAFMHLQETISLTDQVAGADQSLLHEKLVLAWTIVHGFSQLMLDNPGFAAKVDVGPHSARDFLTRVLRLSQPAFLAQGIAEAP